MIYAYVGRPRSGKSLDAVKMIVHMLKQGRIVCTDIEGLELNPSQCRDARDFDKHCRVVISALSGLSMAQLEIQLIFLTPSQVLRFWCYDEKKLVENQGTEFESVRYEKVPVCPSGSLIVIDEVHKKFSCHDNRTDKNRAFSDWASTHGHDGFDVILITQDIMKVESHVRSLIETTYYYRKVNFFGALFTNKYMKYIYDGYEHDGKPICKPTTHNYDKEYYRAYKSMSHRDVKQYTVQKNHNILKHPVFFAIPLIICFCLYMFFYKSSFASGDIFGATKVQKKHDSLVKQGVQAVSKPILPNFSTSKIKQPVPVMRATALIPEQVALPLPVYSRVNVDGYIFDDGKTVIQVAGSVVRLPSPYVKSFNKGTMSAVVDSDYFGIKTVAQNNFIPQVSP